MFSASGQDFKNRDLSFEFNYPSSDVYVGSDSVGSFNGTIKNISTGTITIAVVRRVNALAETWTSSICLGQICYNESLDSVAIELNAGDSTFCGILIWTAGADTGMIQLDLFDLTNINEHIFVDLNIYTSTTAGVGDNTLVPEQIILYPAFPNPFNPVTEIGYELKNDIYISLIIYDIIGNNIKSLVMSDQTAGYQSVRWNATNNLGAAVSAGIYIYMIQAGGFSQSRKILLLK
tara:strand:+ start:239 stop:940 length:702 start_codon:yes stop_codon:yes gene_type:complete